LSLETIDLNSERGDSTFTSRSPRLALITQSNFPESSATSDLLSLNDSRRSRFARFLSWALVLIFFEAVMPTRWTSEADGFTNTVIKRPSKRLPTAYTSRNSAGFKRRSLFGSPCLNNAPVSASCDLSRDGA